MGPLSSTQQQFVLHWGEMSSRWGINRSMAQIHALLYLSSKPVNAEQISDQLSMARSNVSTSLRELQAWGVVRVTHRLGDRRDHFAAVGDVWELFLTILDQRKKREIDPTVDMLRACLDQHEASHGEEDVALGRMRDLLDMLEMLVGWYEQVRRLSPATQRRVLRLGNRLERVVGIIDPASKGEQS